MDKEGKIIILMFAGFLFVVSGIFVYGVGGWKLVAGIWFFGWALNLSNKNK